MCGIAGYNGFKPAEPFLHQALTKLEYRGYDSYGYLVSNQGEWFLHREVGKSVKDSPLKAWQGTTGISHTRCAMHGASCITNTHPILCGQRIEIQESFYRHFHLFEIGPQETVGEPTVAIVHNGTVDNYEQLKKDLSY